MSGWRARHDDFHSKPTQKHNPPSLPVGPDEEEGDAQLRELREHLGEGRPCQRVVIDLELSQSEAKATSRARQGQNPPTAARHDRRVVLVVEVQRHVAPLEVLERDGLALLLLGVFFGGVCMGRVRRV